MGILPGDPFSVKFDAEAILFDLDGVLANSNAVVEGAWRRWATEKRLDAEEIIKYSHGRRTTETLERFLPGQPHAPEIASLLDMEHQAIGDVVDVAGARDFVQALGDVPWAVATSGEMEIATSRLKKIDIPIPRVLITAEQVQRGKPDPEVYLTAARSLGVDPRRCIALEDAPSGIAAARAAGARVIALLTTFSRSDLHEADAVIQDFRDIRAERTDCGVRLRIISP